MFFSLSRIGRVGSGGWMNTTAQQFLKELDDKLWKDADKLRSNLDASN